MRSGGWLLWSSLSTAEDNSDSDPRYWIPWLGVESGRTRTLKRFLRLSAWRLLRFSDEDKGRGSWRSD